MSDVKQAKMSGSTVYEAPRVTQESLDGGGNYVGPTWPERKVSADAGASYGAGTLGNSIIE